MTSAVMDLEAHSKDCHRDTSAWVSRRRAREDHNSGPNTVPKIVEAAGAVDVQYHEHEVYVLLLNT
jgi:hypothetical protein